MSFINLRYGRSSIPFEFDPARFKVLGAAAEMSPLSDAEIGQKLDNPIGSPPIEEIVNPGDSVLIVVPDATRQTASGQMVNLVVRRLIANGTAPYDIRIIFATGIHRRVTPEEKAALLTSFIAQRIKTIDHDPRDLASLIGLGETSGGIPIELNRAVTEHDKIILIGGVTFHYFAGFTGGRKLVCPGLASSKTTAKTHALAFDCSQKARREGVDTGLLEGNAVNEAFMEIVAKVDPAFCISTIVDDTGQAVDLYCGDWRASHRAACDAFASQHTIAIDKKRDLVIASCGGYPHDINMIQAHKTLDAASRACRDGGIIVLIAECPDGLGRDDFLAWFEAENNVELADKLCEKYQVNGQTAWNLLRNAERFNVKVISSLETFQAAKMRLEKVDSSECQRHMGEGWQGYIMPDGAKVLVDAQSVI